MPLGCDTTNVIVCVVPIGNAPPKDLFKEGVAAETVTHAPVVLEPPPAALFPTFALTFVVAPILTLPLVLLA